jgi:N-acetylneuraminic acid mutarotase
MKKTLFTFFVFITSVSIYAQHLVWTPIADFPNVRYATHSFMIGSKFYVGGGLSSYPPPVANSDLQEYDSATNVWTQKASLPGNLSIYGASSFVLNGKGYMVCGEIVPGSYNYNSTLYEYDPTSDSWSSKATFPGSGRYTATSFSIGNYGFVGLGFSPLTNTFYKYDPNADAWSQIDSFPGIGTGRQSPSSFVIGGTAYVGAGGEQIGSNFINYHDFYKYDTATGHWTVVAPMPGAATRNAFSFSLNGKGYVIGGIDSAYNVLNNTWEYDPQSNTWAELDTFVGSSLEEGATGYNSNYAIIGLGQANGANYPFTTKLWKTSGVNTGITDVTQNKSHIWFYGNTAHVRFEKSLSESTSFTLYDLNGREIITSELKKGESDFDISLNQFSDGMYVYTVPAATQNESKLSGKFVIIH